MDYEEKYKNLVKAVKELREANPSDEGIQNWLNENVPELVESEGERIRKELIEHIKSNCETPFVLFEKFSPDMILSWLEKQGKNELNTEDRCIIQDTISICERARKKATNEIDYENVIRCIDWLKSFIK